MTRALPIIGIVVTGGILAVGQTVGGGLPPAIWIAYAVMTAVTVPVQLYTWRIHRQIDRRS